MSGFTGKALSILLLSTVITYILLVFASDQNHSGDIDEVHMPLFIPVLITISGILSVLLFIKNFFA